MCKLFHHLRPEHPQNVIDLLHPTAVAKEGQGYLRAGEPLQLTKKAFVFDPNLCQGLAHRAVGTKGQKKNLLGFVPTWCGARGCQVQVALWVTTTHISPD